VRGVGLKKLLVDLKLAGVAKGKEVNNAGDVDKHVVTKGDRPGAWLFKAELAVQHMTSTVMARAWSMRLLATI